MEGELPDLKAKQRERKGAGLVLPTGAALRQAFTGATGGLGPAAALLPAGARAVVARLAATLGGQVLLAGSLTLVLSATLALAHRALFGTAASRVGGPTPDLGALTSSLRIRRPKRSRALDYLALAYRNELNLDATVTEARKPLFVHHEQQAPQDAAPADNASAEDQAERSADDWSQALAGGAWRQARLSGTQSQARLSDGSGGDFGTKDVFQDTKAPKFGQGFDRSKIASLATPVEAPKRAKPTLSMLRSIGVRSVRVHAGRAITQLKASQGLSGIAANVSGEGATTLAANAFEGQIAGGGAAAPAVAMDQPDAAPSGTVNLLGDTAPPPDAKPANATEYQAELNQAYNLGSQAGDMKKQAMMLMIIGLALIALGAALLHWPGVGIALIIVGTALIGQSAMLSNRAKKMGQQAKQIGKTIRRQYGQTAQGDIVDECMDQAVNEGVKPQDCKYKTKPPSFQSSAGAAAKDQLDATYTVDDGNGKPADAADLQSAVTATPRPEPGSSPSSAAPSPGQ